MTTTQRDDGGAAFPRREIFMAGGRYLVCNVLLHDGDYLLCSTPEGREFIAKPGYGTWCEISLYDLLYKLKDADAMLAERRKP